MSANMASYLLALMALIGYANCKTYERCELARELKFVHEAPDEQIPVWVCIAEHESQYNTSAVGNLNGDGSGDHGLFQISDLFWCSREGKGFACNLECSSLEDDDIEDDYECAKKIYKEHKELSGDGFNAWAVYQPFCKDSRVEKYVKDCFNASDLATSTQPPLKKKKTTTKKVYPWLVPRPTSTEEPQLSKEGGDSPDLGNQPNIGNAPKASVSAKTTTITTTKFPHTTQKSILERLPIIKYNHPISTSSTTRKPNLQSTPASRYNSVTTTLSQRQSPGSIPVFRSNLANLVTTTTQRPTLGSIPFFKYSTANFETSTTRRPNFGLIQNTRHNTANSVTKTPTQRQGPGSIPVSRSNIANLATATTRGPNLASFSVHQNNKANSVTTALTQRQKPGSISVFNSATTTTRRPNFGSTPLSRYNTGNSATITAAGRQSTTQANAQSEGRVTDPGFTSQWSRNTNSLPVVKSGTFIINGRVWM